MISKFFSKKFISQLGNLEYGSLKLKTPDGKEYSFFGDKNGIEANLNIYNWDVIINVFLKGDDGFLKSYMYGHWNTKDLPNLLIFILENKNTFNNVIFGTRLFRYLNKINYIFKENTIKGSKKNISQHYDLGNNFYSLWLDSSMTYSAALFKFEKESLEYAQNNKHDRILDCLKKNSGSLLDIGCGWGGFLNRAYERGNFNLNGITLSEEQYKYNLNVLKNKAKINLSDYRNQSGKFDHIVSIEMFEAVGAKYWKTFFNKVYCLLKENGRAVVQTIVINDEGFLKYSEGGDFLRTHIFPGGMLTSSSRFRKDALDSGFKIIDTYYFGNDYAKTLKIWLETFDKKVLLIKDQGFDEEFIKLWRFYLSACIAGFKTYRINVMQVVLANA